jgi:hypothetical protein
MYWKDCVFKDCWFGDIGLLGSARYVEQWLQAFRDLPRQQGSPQGGKEPTLMMLRCKNCGTEFPSGIQMDKRSFESATLAANAEKCPACEQVRGYDKEEYFFGQGIGS